MDIMLGMLAADEPATLEAQFAPPTPLPPPNRNSRNSLDVNDDGHLSSIDALLVINYLNSRNSTTTQAQSFSLAVPIASAPYYDTNGDTHVSSIDALLVINALNSGQAGEGEGTGPLAAESELPAAQNEEFADLISLLAADTAEQASQRRRIW